MPLNAEDEAMLNAERDASPDRFQHAFQNRALQHQQDHERYLNDPEGARAGGGEAEEAEEQDSGNTEASATQGIQRRQEAVEEIEDPSARRMSVASSHSSLTHSTSSHSRVASLRGQPSSRPQPVDRQSTGTIHATQSQVDRYLERHPTALQRTETHRLQQQNTVGSSKLRSRTNKSLPAFGDNKPYPPILPEKEDYVVEFNGHDDLLHPQNWKTTTKTYIAAILIFDSLSATLSSSIFSNASPGIEAEFGVGREVATLGTSLFVLGYAFGPIIWAPFSELYGRRLPIIIAAFGFGIFNIGVAVAKDVQTIMICRFFGGLFGSCPLAVVAAVFADMYNNKYRGLAVASFSATVFMGPLMGPFLGGFISISYLGWRWTQYITAIMGFFACIMATIFQKESYPPVILVSKASELRRLTKNWGIHAKQEEVEVDLKELLTKNVSRPMRILFTEPIVLLITIYMSFLYGLLYLFLTAYSLVFEGVYGFNAGVAGLPYFGFITGEIIGFICVVLMNPGYARKLEQNNDIPVPEWRLPLVMAGGISFTIGLFWFGWTGYTSSIPWIVPTLSGLASGFGIFTVFLQLLNYIVDAYLMFAASAIAANTFMRSLFGAVFPLFAYYMFEGIGINYGMTLIGCVSALMIPMPFVFYFFGKRIRAKSNFAPAPDIEQDKRRARDEESGPGSDESNDSNGAGEKKDE